MLWWIIIGLHIIPFNSINCQTASRLNNMRFHKLDQSKGLSELQNAYISSDSRGFVWLGSYDGLNRYDGKEIKIYKPLHASGVLDGYISSKVFEDMNGKLWFTTYKGLYLIDPQTDFPVNIPIPGVFNELLDDCYAFHLEKGTLLWLIADDTLRKFDLLNRNCYATHFLSTYVCEPILNKKQDVIGLAVPKPDFESGFDIILYQKGGKIEKYSYFDQEDLNGLPFAMIIGANAEGDSLLWLTSNIGLIKFSIKEPKKYTLFQSNTASKSTLTFDQASWKGLKWVTQNPGGLCLFDPKGNLYWSSRYIKVDQHLIDVNKLNNLLLTKDETLWVSSWGNGVFYTNIKSHKFDGFSKLEESSNLERLTITSLAVDRHGFLWGATQDGQLFTMKEESLTNHRTVTRKYQLPFNETSKRVFTDENGGFWLQIGDELWMREQDFSRFKLIGRNLDGVVKVIWSPIGYYFILTTTKLIQIKLDASSQVLDFDKLKPQVAWERVYEIYTLSSNTLLISDGFDKLFIYSHNSNGVRMEKEINNVGYINGLVEDRGKKLIWLASSKGLLLMKELSCSIVPFKTNPVLLKPINAIQKDDQGRLWLSSNAGLFRYDPITGGLKCYTESDGLQGLQFMPGSAATLPDGRLAFGGVNGLNVFHPDSIHDNPNPPRIHFTNWVVNDTGSVSTAPEFLTHQTFSSDQRTLSFYFVGIDFSAPDEVLYRYRLKGYDQDTVDGGYNGFARYAQLPAGTYTFQIWAANSDGIWSTEPHELSFTVLPPWYKTWWAYTIYVLAALSGIYWFYRIRVARIQKEEEARRKEAEFRQKEAEAKQLAAEWQNAVLRLQMNPHFLFNSMNSISSYLLQKDVDTAQDYLARFSKLMRRILELAAKPFIAIQEEVELLEQYMAVESMRFENAFHWTVSIASDIDPDDVQVPTMILQPFVENAIWHGFSGQNSHGHIQIGFFMQNGMLCCTVEDNGAGRKKSQSDEASRKVTAIQITRQRLAGFKPVGGQQPQLHFQDLFHPDGSAAGTKVEIWLPPDL